MSVPFAYIGVILIWSTTPLAVQWSSAGGGFLFGVGSRMLLGVALALLLTALPGSGLLWSRRAVRAYLAAGLGIYGAMLSVYWSAQFIPSGWIAVIFGLTPVITGLMAARWLDGEALDGRRIAGMLLGLLGLAVIFGSGFSLHAEAWLGIAGVLLSALIHSASSVWVKHIRAELPAMVQTSGGLLVAAPLFLLTWIATGASLPTALPERAMGAIVYLALIGSVVGFSLFYYVLRHVQATKVALITLVTPVLSLLLGHLLNSEPLTLSVMLGTALIVAGLALFELNSPLQRLKLMLQRE